MVDVVWQWLKTVMIFVENQVTDKLIYLIGWCKIYKKYLLQTMKSKMNDLSENIRQTLKAMTIKPLGPHDGNKLLSNRQIGKFFSESYWFTTTWLSKGQPAIFAINTASYKNGKLKKVYQSYRYTLVDDELVKVDCKTIMPINLHESSRKDDDATFVEALKVSLKKQGSWWQQAGMFNGFPAIHVIDHGQPLRQYLEFESKNREKIDFHGFAKLLQSEDVFLKAFFRLLDQLIASQEIHLDIKADNVLVDAAGDLTLIDFPSQILDPHRYSEFDVDFSDQESAIGGIDQPLLIMPFQDVWALLRLMVEILEVHHDKTQGWLITETLKQQQSRIEEKYQQLIEGYFSGCCDYELANHAIETDEKIKLMMSCFWADNSYRSRNECFQWLESVDAGWLKKFLTGFRKQLIVQLSPS